MRCCAPYCQVVSSTSQGISFFRFPNNPDLRWKWIQFCGSCDWTSFGYRRICSRHFEPSLMLGTDKAKRLKKGAVPTIHCVPPENRFPRPAAVCFANTPEVGAYVEVKKPRIEDAEQYCHSNELSNPSEFGASLSEKGYDTMINHGEYVFYIKNEEINSVLGESKKLVGVRLGKRKIKSNTCHRDGVNVIIESETESLAGDESSIDPLDYVSATLAERGTQTDAITLDKSNKNDDVSVLREQQTSLAESETQTDPDCEDLRFFQRLLPDVRKLTSKEKYFFRQSINQILSNFVSPSKSNAPMKITLSYVRNAKGKV